MCSIEQRIAEFGRAIDEFAIKAGMPAESRTHAPNPAPPSGDAPAAQALADAAGPGPAVAKDEVVAISPDDSGRMVARLAELWGLLAELDPEVAKRLPGYQALLSPAR